MKINELNKEDKYTHKMLFSSKRKNLIMCSKCSFCLVLK